MDVGASGLTCAFYVLAGSSRSASTKAIAAGFRSALAGRGDFGKDFGSGTGGWRLAGLKQQSKLYDGEMERLPTTGILPAG